MPALGTGKPASQRFWSHVDKKGPDDCWLWRGAAVAGYGVLSGDEKLPSGFAKMVKAHRLSWMIANGRPIPPGLIVCHTCDVPLCVNPSHLFLGTYTDNRRDQIDKGRAPSRAGERNGAARLTQEQVEWIRPLRGRRTAQVVAAEYDVSPQAIYDIWQGRTWVKDAARS